MLKHKVKSGKSLFREYFSVIFFIILICFTLMGAMLIFFARGYWENEKTRLLSENSQAISRTTVDIITSEHGQSNRSNAALLICNDLTLLSSAIDADIFICDLNGQVVYCKEMRRENMVLFTGDCVIHQKYKISQSILDACDVEPYSGISTLDGILPEKSFVYVSPIKVKESVIGYIAAVQTVSETMNPFVLEILKIFLISAIFAMAISLIAVYFMSYEMTKPLRQMSAATKSYANGDFSVRIQKSNNVEMAELATAFNAMARDLASLESSRRSFVANVSHELKTPMTTIGGFIDGILDHTIDESKRDYYLGIVSDEIKRLSRLVTGMLNMSKIEAGELKLKPTDFDISELVFKTSLGFEQLIENKKIEVLGFDKLESTTVHADEDMLHQVIYNLIDNAVKFTPEGGVIEFGVVSDMQKVYVSVSNSGVGIPSEELEKVFERFYKIDKSRSYDVKGAGLGLYIVKSIIEMHSGQIKVESIPNQRTTFSFWIPVGNS